MNRMIHWIQPRIRTESVSISPLNYEERKGILLGKWEQMKKYLEGLECRASALESYFGQAPSKPCGTCDACFARIGIDQQAFLKAIPAKGLPIKTWLSSKPLLEQATCGTKAKSAFMMELFSTIQISNQSFRELTLSA